MRTEDEIHITERERAFHVREALGAGKMRLRRRLAHAHHNIVRDRGLRAVPEFKRQSFEHQLDLIEPAFLVAVGMQRHGNEEDRPL